MGKTALVLGASGLVGQELVTILVESKEFERITLLVRKELKINSAKINEIVIDFEKLEEYKEEFNVDIVFCTLGTTIKKAKTKENFEKVDFHYPIEGAKLSKNFGKGHFFVVTAMGSDENSSVFYSKTKGRLEKELKNLGLNNLSIFRPSLLLGERKELRVGERIGTLLFSIIKILLVGRLKKYAGIEARDVAFYMYEKSLENSTGIFIYESDKMQGSYIK